MVIDAVKSVDPNITSQRNKIAVSPNAELQKQENKAALPANVDSPEQENKNGKYLLMAGLAGLGVIGIYILTRGKKGSSSKLPDAVPQSVAQIEDMAIDAFKKACNKFEKGIAKLANGENYTGKITQQLDKKTIIREYKNGILQKASQIDDSGRVLLEKTFHYDEVSGKLLSVNSGNHKLLQRVYDNEGNLKYLFIDPLDHTQFSAKLLEFHPNGKIKTQFKVKAGAEHMFKYDENGNLEKTIFKPLTITGLHDASRFGDGIGANVMSFNSSGKDYSWVTDKLPFGPRQLKTAERDTIKVVAGDQRFDIEIVNIDGDPRKIYIDKRTRTFGKRPENEVVLEKVIGDDVAQISYIGENGAAEYNIKTQKVELPQGFTHTEEEVRNIAKELLDQARMVKNEIGNHRKDVDEYMEYSKLLSTMSK